MAYHCTPTGYKEKLRELAELGPDRFYPFFSGGTNVDTAFDRSMASWHRNIQPFINEYVASRGPLSEQSSLDIGYGGGVHVMMAAEQFHTAYGVDVHQEDQIVTDTLNLKGAVLPRIMLLHTPGASIPLPPNFIDFVHSWTTFMHVGHVEVVKRYLGHIRRVLKPGGYGLIYFSRLVSGKTRVESMDQYKESLAEEARHKTGFAEGGGTGPPNSINLRMALWFFEHLVYKAGMQPVERTVSGNIVDGKKMAAAQHGLLFRKPVKEVTP